jgi:hypothetical protein
MSVPLPGFLLFFMKYNLPPNEHEILPNLLGLTNAEEIAEAEYPLFRAAPFV